tara:strand:+ start:3405 stop:4142 length:738 start_codon:yes stop_codon:yes gene_type:complete
MPEQQEQQLSPEQIKSLQEKIKNMSPEELKEFQKKQCIFCQIVAEKVQSRRVYEDDDVLAILDANPANPGHLLIMPKEHYSIMPQIPEEEIGHIFMVAKALSNASLRALEAQGSNIIIANGVAAGQRAQHFMAHLIPRKGNDNINFQIPQKNISEQELQKIKKVLSESFGAKAGEIREKVAAIPSIPKKKVVEAEFKEEKHAKKKEKIAKKETKKPIKKRQRKEKQAKKSQDINLDDIARVLGTK